MSPFAAQFMTGPLLKAKKGTTTTLQRCVVCGKMKEMRMFIHPPYATCQQCVAREKVKVRREKASAANKSRR